MFASLLLTTAIALFVLASVVAFGFCMAARNGDQGKIDAIALDSDKPCLCCSYRNGIRFPVLDTCELPIGSYYIRNGHAYPLAWHNYTTDRQQKQCLLCDLPAEHICHMGGGVNIVKGGNC